MRLQIIASTFLFLTASLLLGQGFDITYPNQHGTYIWGQIEQTLDGGYIVGSRGDADFLKLDPQGQIEWTFKHPSGTDTDGIGSLINPDGSIILGGTRGQNLGYIVKVDANGQTIWDRLTFGEVKYIRPGNFGRFWMLDGCCLGSMEVSMYSASSGGHSWSEYNYRQYHISGAADNGVLIAGDRSNSYGSIHKIDELQNEVWQYSDTIVTQFLAVVEGSDGSVYGVGGSLVKLDPSGNLIFRKNISGQYAQSIRELPNGNLVIAGRKGQAWMSVVTPQGDLVSEKIFSGGRAYDAIPTTDGGIAVLIGSASANTKVVKMDAQGNVHNTFITGSMYYDVDGNCTSGGADSLVANKTITATNVNTGSKYFGSSDANGFYSVDAPAGDYTMSAGISANWEPCSNTLVTLPAGVNSVQAPDKVYEYNANPTGILQGYVYLDSDSSCEFDQGEEALECIKIPFVTEGQFFPIYYAETDENGFFSIEVPYNNHYYIYNFSNNLAGVPAASGCGWDGFYLPAYDTLNYTFPLIDNFTTPAQISGHIFFDENLNCEKDSAEIGTDEFSVGFVAQGSQDTLSTNVLSDGYFARILESGVYEVFVNVGTNLNWQPCDTSITVLADATCMDEVNLGVQPATTCPDFEVSIGTNLLRICDDSNIFLYYKNYGTTAGEPVIQVILDTLMTYQSSSIAPTQINGDTLIFEPGLVGPLAFDQIAITVFLSCDAVFGETHCVEATVSTEEECEDPFMNWDGSSVKISGACMGDQINITIENIGDQAMTQESNYFVIEDNILLYTTPFLLGIGEQITFPITPNGASIFIEAEQSANHPGNSMPALSFEGCGQNAEGTFSLGYITQYRQDDADRDVSIFCLENINSYDPNDKVGFPRGVTEAHLIEPNIQLEYMIRFQNIGTAPALKVVIEDELSPYLKAKSIRPGASSHPYQFQRIGNQVTFTFDNINLPDSMTNLEASQGFVIFKIDQLANNLPGTVINNEADIYFDSNDAITTNQTFHQIPLPILESYTDLEFCAGEYFNDQLLTQDTSFFVTTPYAYFDSLNFYDIAVEPTVLVTIDTAIQLGDSYLGVYYTTPTQLIDSLTAANGCDSIRITNIDILSATDELSNNLEKIKVLPNPTEGLIKILIADLTPGIQLQLQVIDQLGQQILDSKIKISGSDPWQIDLSSFPAGVYFLNIQMEDKNKVAKLVKL